MVFQGKPAARRRPVPRLYLVTQQDASGLADFIAEALSAADFAAVLLRLPDSDERSYLDRIKEIAPAVKDKDTALLLDGHAELAEAAGADGSHLTSVDALKAALPILQPARIAGCGGILTKHDAMVAGEAGADYVMFGEASSPAFDLLKERVAWWAELFEVPCVGFASSLDEVEPLAAAGADFVALGDWVFADRRRCRTAVADAARRMALAETVA